MSQAIQISEYGGPDVLRLVEVTVGEPGPGEVRVRHQACGINFIDIYQRTGLYPVKFPAVLGQEAAGVVESVGEGVTRFKVGDRVAYAGQTGAYAQSQAVPEARAVKIPDAVSSEIAAAALLKGMTAEFLLRRCFAVRSGQTILMHAAAGGVGTILTQWAKALGATVIGTVGSEAKAALARANGCDHVILYRIEDVPARVKEITGGKGVPVVYDAVGKDTVEMSLSSLARRGLLVSFGNASGPVPPIPPLRLLQGGSLYMTRPTMGDYTATPEELDESSGALFDVIRSGKVKIEIGQRFALEDTKAAHEALGGRKTTGATVLVP